MKRTCVMCDRSYTESAIRAHLFAEQLAPLEKKEDVEQ